MKQSLESCLAEYTDMELIGLHANLNALFLCCNEDFKLFPLLMRIHFALTQRNTRYTIAYLKKIDALLKVPAEYKHA